MTLIKNVFKILAVTALFSSANVFAADFLVNTTINDSNHDALGSNGTGWKYEIDKMDVQWADSGLITVDIYTNFVGHNGKNGSGRYGHGNIVLGDLLIGTKGESNPYDYAFVLSDKDRNKDYSRDYSNGTWDKHWDKQGTFTEIGSTLTSKDYHGKYSSTASGEVMAGTTKGSGTQSNWSVDNYGRYSGKTDKISFSFNVNGIDAFQNASQLAFSWAMSCANDVVDGVVNVDRPTSVPEPTTLLLMLLALGFMAKSRSNKSNDFSA
ncbi:PEP-CTERM sorting domain-containing protein [Colwellia sp. Bg11-28]|jgi:hypothetical protein|uniref:PEP-CTERM sorting domain-containing protein n=1 Tax=Colwellia sp. Bg11-28 TaxID=2058305 RepID=UPI000C32975F|nr:PEP-CTERM sorting domain-containing protein [Colwellia sp. Bg11-28]PKH88422.1 hypothetical protein CXF79_06620 [Colwellia sp. Bg11-28]